MAKTNHNLTEESTPKGKKAKSAKGAPAPRKQRGRTINRRRERFIRKTAKKLAEVRDVRDAIPSYEINFGQKQRYENLTQEMVRLSEAIANSKAAQSRMIASLKK